MKISEELLEKIAEQIHIRWAKNRKAQGWTYGIERNDEKRETPCLVEYAELSEEEKEYDRETARATIEALEQLGYDLVKKE